MQDRHKTVMLPLCSRMRLEHTQDEELWRQNKPSNLFSYEWMYRARRCDAMRRANASDDDKVETSAEFAKEAADGVGKTQWSRCGRRLDKKSITRCGEV
jgi:hypothetical protein